MRATAILIALLAVLPAFGQRLHHYDLAPTRDGSLLYFSFFRPSTSPDTRIYRWSRDAGVTLFGERPDLSQASSSGQHLYGTQTTHSGSVLFHAEPRCSTGFGPGFNNCSIGETQIVIPGAQPFSVAGFLLVSPNGRYGVFATFDNHALWVDWFTGEEIGVDLPFQSVAGVNPPFSVNQHAVADNGRFLIAGGDRVRVWSKNGETVLRTTDLIQNAAISADGATVAITVREPSDRSAMVPTYVYDLRPGSKTKFESSHVSMSEDGQTIAYLTGDVNGPNARAQAMVARANGTAARQITNLADGTRSAVLSGDGRYLFVAAGGDPAFSAEASYRIQRYNLATGGVDNIPAVP